MEHTNVNICYVVTFCIVLLLLGGEGVQSLQINVHVGQSHGSVLQSPQRSGPQESETEQGAGE